MSTNKEYTINDIYEIAGKELTDKMQSLINDPKDLIHWFYEPNKFYDNRSPSEICKDDIHTLNRDITDILTGAHGG